MTSTRTYDQAAMSEPEDFRVGPHPFTGRSDRWCELPGCNRPDRNPIHDSAPEGSRVLEAAKAVARLADRGDIAVTPKPPGYNREAFVALAMLQQALTIAGHGTRRSESRKIVIAEVARIKAERPEVYAALRAAGEIQVRNPDICPGCGAHSLVPCEPNCDINGVMATYQREGR